jgi:phosphate/sulfate permease
VLTFIAFIVLVALAFDFLTGFHDAADCIATAVSTTRRDTELVPSVSY